MTSTTSIFVTVSPSRPDDIALILKSSPSSSSNNNNNNNSIKKQKGQESIITNHDLLRAKNKGKIQIHNSPYLTVNPSYRNCNNLSSSMSKSMTSSSLSMSSSEDGKLSPLSLLTLIIPPMILLCAILSFFLCDTSLGMDNGTDDMGNGTGTGTNHVNKWDAIFPSHCTTFIVFKLTIWGTLIAFVAYEQSHYWYGSNSSNSNGDVGLEVVLDNNDIGMDMKQKNNMIVNGNIGNKIRNISDASISTVQSSNKEIDMDRKKNNIMTSTTNGTSSPSTLTISTGTPKSSSLSSFNLKSASISVPNANANANASIQKTFSEDPPDDTTPTPKAKNNKIVSINTDTPKSPASTPTAASSSSLSSSTSTSTSLSTNNTVETISNNKSRSLTTTTPNLPSSPTKIPKSPSTIPFRFIRATKGDIDAARIRWNDTLKWREEIGMDTILSKPHPKIHIIKENYPHYFHLRGKKNECCYYEKPPKMNLPELKRNGVELEDALIHYALCCEYMWTHIDSTEEAKSIYVIDLEGIGFRDFAGDVVDFVKRASSFCGDHYPERSGSIYLINVPSWFSVIWNAVKPMVDDVTKKKITIMRYGMEAITKALMEKIDIENIPPEYGGKSVPLGQAPEELGFMEHYEKLNKNLE